MMPGKVRKIVDWPIPRNRTELKAFLGLASYYRWFIQGFAEIAVELNKLTSKAKVFEWKEKEEKAFEKLKSALTSEPVLAKPNFQKGWFLDVDASQNSLGTVLSQDDDDGINHPVYFWSRQLGKAERNYSTTDRECLVVVTAMRKFRPYILGAQVVVRGDHTAVKWIMNKLDISMRHARWRIILSEYDYEIISRPGRANDNADALFRLLSDRMGEEEVDAEADGDFAFRALALQKRWLENDWYKDIYLYLETSKFNNLTKSGRERVR